MRFHDSLNSKPFQELYKILKVRRTALDPMVEIDLDREVEKLMDYSELEVILFWY